MIQAVFFDNIFFFKKKKTSRGDKFVPPERIRVKNIVFFKNISLRSKR